MATRRAPEARFDHGAQFFTAQDAAFRRHVASWLGDGVVARWSPRVLRIDAQGEVGAADDRGDRPWYVGAPSMSALTRHLAADLAVQTDWPVHRTERRPDGWYLWPTETPAGGAGSPHATGAAGPFDRVLVAVPAPQATALVTASPGLAGIAQAARLAPCWTVMLRLAPGPVPDFDALRAAGALAWAAREASKPGRSPSADWVLQASTAWSAAHLEAAPEAVAAALVSAFQAAWARVAPALPAPVATEAHAHRWRHALGRGAAPDGPRAHFDHDTGLGLAGDWLGAGRVESAWLSGVALAAHVLAAASPRLPVD